MWRISLSTHEMSKVVWRRLFAEYSFEVPGVLARLGGVYERLERDRSAMSYKTGSISMASALTLYVITRKVNPSFAFEVGTFIGRSATAIMTAMDVSAKPNATFQTCDASNDFVMDTSAFRTQMLAMPRTDSTTALGLIAASGRQIDLFHLDGRLQTPDLELVAKAASSDAAFALDDFEGIEKGVVNALLLKNIPRFAGYFLIEPPAPEALAPFGVNDRCLTAMLVPMSAFALTPQ